MRRPPPSPPFSRGGGLRGRAGLLITVAAVLIVVAAVAGCRAPIDSLQVVLDRHARAVERLPEEQQNLLMPYGAAVVSEKAEDLLPRDVLTLEAARSIAVRANPDVHAAEARLQLALARVSEARSRYYPSVTVTHNSTRTLQTPASRNRLATGLQPAPLLPADGSSGNLALTSLLNALRRPLFGLQPKGDTNPFSEHSTAFTTSWMIFDGFVREAQLMAAKYLESASTYSLMDVQRLIVRSVDAAYYQVQLAREQVRIAQADEAFSREQYEETKKLQAAGRSTKADVDNFRVRVLAAQANLAAAEGLRETGRVVLAELMGLDGSDLPADLGLSPLEEETEDELAVPGAAPWLERALAIRPDLLQLGELLRGEEENVRAAKGAYQPVIMASGSWGFDRTSNVHYSDQDQSSAGGVEFRWELFNGGARAARVRAAESSRASASASLTRSRLAVQAEVRKAVIDVSNSQRQIRLQRENLTTARENRRIVQAGYLAGKETLNRLNEAQRDYITVDADLSLARIRLRQAWSDLRAAAGSLATNGSRNASPASETEQPSDGSAPTPPGGS